MDTNYDLLTQFAGEPSGEFGSHHQASATQVDSFAPGMWGGAPTGGPAFGAGSIVNQDQGEIGTQFGIHKISYDPEGHVHWKKDGALL